MSRKKFRLDRSGRLLLASADGRVATGATRQRKKTCPTKKGKNPLDSDRPSHGRRLHSSAQRNGHEECKRDITTAASAALRVRPRLEELDQTCRIFYWDCNFHKSFSPPWFGPVSTPYPPKSHKVPEASVQPTALSRAPGRLFVEAVPSVP